MVAGSILPVSLNHKNELCFLFGKENPMEDSAKGYSDFGGRMDKGETPYTAALREGSEELTGFLGDKKQLQKMIKKNGGHYQMTFDTYHVHMVFLEYDENLPKYYNFNHRFLWNKMDKKLLNKTKLFEKELFLRFDIPFFIYDDGSSEINFYNWIFSFQRSI